MAKLFTALVSQWTATVNSRGDLDAAQCSAGRTIDVYVGWKPSQAQPSLYVINEEKFLDLPPKEEYVASSNGRAAHAAPPANLPRIHVMSFHTTPPVAPLTAPLHRCRASP